MTKIEWTHRPNSIGVSWNLIGGCTKVSPACDHCYALRDSWRIQNNPKRPERYEDVAAKVPGDNVYPPYYEELMWTGRINLDWDALEQPCRWKKPRTVFVCSMGDLFHERVPDEFISRAFQVMAWCEEHTFLVLTKRARRMVSWFAACIQDGPREVHLPGEIQLAPVDWPLPNIWLMVTAENQEWADRRIPYLLQTPAAVRGVSAEPMLGAVDLLEYIDCPSCATANQWISTQLPCTCGDMLDWVIIGAESGANRREFSNIDAMRLVYQCDDADVPVFVKQIHNADGRVSKNPDDWPEPLRRREWPR